MLRAEVRERAKTDPAYAAVLGMCGLEIIDDDTLCLMLGRALMAISSIESNGWMLIKANSKSLLPSCDPHFGVPT